LTTFQVGKISLQPRTREKKFLLISLVCGGLILNLLPKASLANQIYNLLYFN